MVSPKDKAGYLNPGQLRAKLAEAEAKLETRDAGIVELETLRLDNADTIAARNREIDRLKRTAATLEADSAKSLAMYGDAVAERDAERERADTLSGCLDSYQARFNALHEAWRSGSNDTVLDALRLHLAGDDTDKGATNPETERDDLASINDELASTLRGIIDERDDANEEIDRLRERLALGASQIADSELAGRALISANERADKAEATLTLIGDKAVTDWDAATVGQVDAVITRVPDTYKAWARGLMAAPATIIRLQEALAEAEADNAKMREAYHLLRTLWNRRGLPASRSPYERERAAICAWDEAHAALVKLAPPSEAKTCIGCKYYKMFAVNVEDPRSTAQCRKKEWWKQRNDTCSDFTLRGPNDGWLDNDGTPLPRTDAEESPEADQAGESPAPAEADAAAGPLTDGGKSAQSPPVEINWGKVEFRVAPHERTPIEQLREYHRQLTGGE